MLVDPTRLLRLTTLLASKTDDADGSDFLATKDWLWGETKAFAVAAERTIADRPRIFAAEAFMLICFGYTIRRYERLSHIFLRFQSSSLGPSCIHSCTKRNCVFHSLFFVTHLIIRLAAEKSISNYDIGLTTKQHIFFVLLASLKVLVTQYVT